MSNLSFQSGFETAKFPEWPTKVGNITQSTAFVREGKFSARCETDIKGPQYAGGARAEFNLDQSKLPTTPYIQSFALSYYLNSAEWQTESDTLLTDILAQWHSDSGQPPIAFGISNKSFYVQSKTINKNLITTLEPATLDTWHDFIFRINWSTKVDGWIEIYYKKSLIGRWTGITYPSGNSEGPFFKCGIYCWPYNTGKDENNGDGCHTTKRVVYIDSVRVGDGTTSIDDLSPAGSVTPLPPPVKILTGAILQYSDNTSLPLTNLKTVVATDNNNKTTNYQ